MVRSGLLRSRNCLFLIPALVLGSFGLPGCEDAYSSAVRYMVRTDPVVMNRELGAERPIPDSPGQLPLMSARDLLEKPNPYYRTEDKEQEDLIQNGKLRDPNQLSGKDRQKLQDTLDQLFGTPADPKVEGVEEEVVTTLALTKENLKKGSSLYRIHCLHCHGLTGNGRGPTAKWINPHPRDYRQGLFKFQSTNQVEKPLKPLRSDLVRTLEEGIEGTAMPSFRLLAEADLHSLASYVIHLSIRGEAEFETLKNAFVFNRQKGVLDVNPNLDDEPAEFLKKITAEVGKEWLYAQDKPIKVAPYPYTEQDLKASVYRGKALFLAEETELKQRFPKGDMSEEKYKAHLSQLQGASCVKCHKDFGRQASYKFDDWGTLVRPADLTRGMYRGGRRPVDIYYRIHSGISGSGMAVLGNNLTGDQIWDIVNFVRILPYPMRKDFGVMLD